MEIKRKIEIDKEVGGNVKEGIMMKKIKIEKDCWRIIGGKKGLKRLRSSNI